MNVARAFADFVRDFVRFAGARGWVAVGLSLMTAAVEAATLVLMVPLLALLAGNLPSGHRAVQAMLAAGVMSAGAQLSLLLAAMALLWLGRGLRGWARDVQLALLAADFADAQRRAIVARLAAADWTDIAMLPQSRVSQALGPDVIRIAQAAQLLVQIMVIGAMLIALSVAAIVIVPVLATMALAGMAGAGGVLALLVRRTHDAGTLALRANQDLTATAARFLGGLKLAIVHNQQADFVAHMDQGLAAVRAQYDAALHQQNVARLALSGLSLGIGVLIVFVGHVSFALPLAQLGALLVVLARLGGPAAQLQHMLHQLAFALPGYGALQALTASINPAPRVSSSAVCAAPPAPLALTQIRFAYPSVASGPARDILHDVTFTLAPGEMVGLGGASGVGKSTLADVLVGLLTPSSGSMCRGGVALTGDAAPGWRARIAYAAQDPYLFYGSVRDNIVWGAQDTGDQAIWAALEVAQGASLVRALPGGLATVIGDQGVTLSGGERQRIALARAVLRGGDLLVLDEATSAIDLATEARIFAALRACTGMRSTLVIAHRAETLAQCDRIVQLDEGRIVPVYPACVR